MSDNWEGTTAARRRGRGWFAALGVVVLIGAIVAAGAVTAHNAADGPAEQPLRAFATVVGNGGTKPSELALAPASTGGGPVMEQRGWADGVEPRWNTCTPGTVTGYAGAQYQLYPQFVFAGMQPTTSWGMKIFVRNGNGWTPFTTTQQIPWNLAAQSGCAVITIPFDEASPPPDGTYLVQPVINGVASQAPGQAMTIGGSNDATSQKARYRNTCVDLPPAYWPGGTPDDDTAFGRASVGLDPASREGAVVFSGGRAAIKATVALDVATFAAADQAVQQQMNPNAYSSHYLRYIVVQNGGAYHAVLAEIYRPLSADAEVNPAPPPCLLSSSQATIVSWHAIYPTYEVNGAFHTIRFDWYSNGGGTFTFPNG
ncbi:MAG TPA: hypothetical protein VEP49_04460 [Acidimicrobiia bacterium]|nr:hypothetical protein [Acidimicrobiia bacterium]